MHDHSIISGEPESKKRSNSDPLMRLLTCNFADKSHHMNHFDTYIDLKKANEIIHFKRQTYLHTAAPEVKRFDKKVT